MKEESNNQESGPAKDPVVDVVVMEFKDTESAGTKKQDDSANKVSNKARRNRKKKAPVTVEEGANDNAQQEEQGQVVKEAGKKKRSRSHKKKAAVASTEEDVENINPEKSAGSKKSTKATEKTAASSSIAAINDKEITATMIGTNASPNEATATKTKANKKKKKSREPLSEVQLDDKKAPSEKKNSDLKQGEYTIDYQGLHDALRDTFSLDDRIGDIHFAPTVSKTKKFEKPVPIYAKSSLSAKTVGDESRNSNKNAPTAKNRHAEIPPPSFMTTERLGKKKSATKSTTNDKTTIEKIKERKVKPSTKKTAIVSENYTYDEVSAPVQMVGKKKHQKQTSLDEHPLKNGKKRLSTTTLGTPVTPIVFHKATTETVTTTKSISKKKEDKKREKKDVANKKLAQQEEYCHPNDVVYGKNRVRFERYVDPKICAEKIKEGKYCSGQLRINKRSRTDAYVTCDNLDADIFIHGQRDRNRALEGDTVVVELLDLETIWAKKKESMIQKREERHKTALERPPVEEGQDDKAKPKYVGKVVHITATNKNNTCSGILSLQQRFGDTTNKEDQQPVDTKNVKLAWFKPVDPRSPLIAIQLKNAPADLLKNEEKYKNLLMVAKMTRWPIDSTNPFGTVVRELGHIGNIPAETQAVLLDNNIVEKPFGPKALKALPEIPWSIKQSDIDKRRDLRETRTFTIDPATAKDLDDAVHVTKLGDDEFEIGVHIADVSHFVHQHTTLDHEAFDRGTSTYLCDRVIPMLPSLLCEELCSLNPGVERLAFSVIWKMDGAGNIKDTWFGKTVIKSCAKLAYDDAQSVIEDLGLPKTATVKGFSVSELEHDIMHLYKISKQMRERRFANGALSINSIRLSFKLNELGEPCGVSIYEQKDANRLIEEFMLCANMSVAQKISQHFPNETLLRQHAPPHERTLNEFIRIAENLGYEIDGSSAGSLQQSFNAIENENVKAVLRLLAVKPMQRAKYFCTGSCDIVQYRHYALNAPLYTHFTSPIRRFADIIVHRQLEAALANKESCGYKKDAVTKAASHCNDRKEGAKNSQDQNIQLYLYHYLHMLETESKQPILRPAIVTQVLKDCFEILVPDYGLEKRVHMDALPIEKFVYDPSRNALAAYWKESVESNREYDQARKLDEDYIEPSGTQLYIENNEESNDESTATKTVYKIPEELLSDNLIDHSTKMQRFEPFSKLTVRIQVNVERSPPTVSVYPVNPFM